jgi:hypothetical protein
MMGFADSADLDEDALSSSKVLDEDALSSSKVLHEDALSSEVLKPRSCASGCGEGVCRGLKYGSLVGGVIWVCAIIPVFMEDEAWKDKALEVVFMALKYFGISASVGMVLSSCIATGCCKKRCGDDCIWMVAMDLTFDRHRSVLYTILLFLYMGLW